MISKDTREMGISLRTINTCLIVGSSVIAVVIIVLTFRLTSSFEYLTSASEQSIRLSNAAHELMDASDYLTEMAQRFCVTGKREYMDNYFAEAFESRRRDQAIQEMSEGKGPAAEAALEDLQRAMDGSLNLMSREYYAMRLVVDAQHITDYPDVLDEVKLTDADASLGPDERMELAASMVHDEEYYRQKDIIRDGMAESLATLEETALKVDHEALDAMNLNTVLLRAVIVFQTVGIFGLVYLISRLGINPILAAVKHIRQDGPIPEGGASEFRYLARAYNKMYEAFQSSLEHMSFKASHDELTGAYNRAGYDLLLSSMDLENTYMVLFDVDNFKQVNDTYGHEIGDEVLQKVVRVLKNHFRSDDYVCRIGGDEFVVFMAHTSRLQHDLLVFKVNHINADLSDTSSDGLPAVSVSVGIAHGSGASSAQDLFERTDAAMYQAKQMGKNTYMFHEDDPSAKA